MAKSKRRSGEWSPQAPEQERAPQAPDPVKAAEAPAGPARDPQDEQSPEGVDEPSMGLDRDLVARRAYDRYLARGGGDGQDLDDWLMAERETMPGNDGPEPDTES